MIKSFKNIGSEDIYNRRNSTDARRLLPRQLWNVVARKSDQIDAAVALDDLRVPPGNSFEALKADCLGQHSIRINDQYRICFKWSESGAEDVEIVDYH